MRIFIILISLLAYGCAAAQLENVGIGILYIELSQTTEEKVTAKGGSSYSYGITGQWRIHRIPMVTSLHYSKNDLVHTDYHLTFLCDFNKPFLQTSYIRSKMQFKYLILSNSVTLRPKEHFLTPFLNLGISILYSLENKSDASSYDCIFGFAYDSNAHLHTGSKRIIPLGHAQAGIQFNFGDHISVSPVIHGQYSVINAFTGDGILFNTSYYSNDNNLFLYGAGLEFAYSFK